MASHHLNFDLDPLCCQEDHFSVDTPLEEEQGGEVDHRNHHHVFLFWEEQELLWLSSKEQDTRSRITPLYPNNDPFLSSARREAVSWVLRAVSFLGFTAQTAVLAVDYFDRFMSSEQGQRTRDTQPWLAQLSAVACLSLAAKVEETHVPLLLDLQVEETRFVFEAKTIQRMELLVLSTLGWRMNPVTPLSFIDHIVRRMGSMNKDKMAGDFQKSCHSILLCLIADSKWVQFLPSVLAAATMLHALEQMDSPCSVLSSFDNENELFALLKTTKEEVSGCYQFILESLVSDGGSNDYGNGKRKRPWYTSPPSPKGVIGSMFSLDSSNDSWAASAVPPSVSSSPEHPIFKRPSNASNRHVIGCSAEVHLLGRIV